LTLLRRLTMFYIKKLSFFFVVILLGFVLIPPAYASNYTVAKGDTIYSISKIFNTNVQKIKTDNKLSNEIIQPGQVLKVPATDYTIKSGDTLYLISKKTGVPLSTLRKANNKWDDSIFAGQKLVIPSVNEQLSDVKPSKPTVKYSTAELDLLARLINAEAASEPYQAMVAVGAVVVNRVQDSRFPNTITDVIYQKDSKGYQFKPVENGLINKPITSSSKAAAIEALNGVDPTNGALFFFDTRSTNQWLLSKPVSLKVGKMVFAY
jgi:N-acetylmuramoyl-L-alanine amidase